MNKKVLVSALSSLLAVSALAGCSGGSPSDGGSGGSGGGSDTASTGGGTLRFGCSGFEGIFNPILSDNVYDSWAVDLLFDSLVTNDPEGSFIPELATWEISEDNLTYTFTLFDGVQFSNGNPLTADDVAFTYNTIKEDDYAGPRLNVAQAIADIEVIDDKTIAFTMTVASPKNIANFTYGIVEAASYQHSNFEEFAAKNDQPVGAGPFVLEGWAPKQYVHFVRNENYWDKENMPTLDGVLFSNIEEDSALLAALQNGEIDFFQPQAKKENVDAIDEMAGAHLVSYLANGYTHMCFNTQINKLSDVRVRQALMYALDRRSFLQLEYGSDQLVALGMAPISKTSWAYPGDEKLNAYDYDLDKANALLDEAGWIDTNGNGIRDKDGEELELTWLVYPEATWPGTLSGMAYDSWGQVGVKLNIENRDFNTVGEIYQTGGPGEKEFEIFTMGFSLAIDPDPSGGLFDYDACRDGGFDGSCLYDERAQELIKLGLEEFDQDKRAEYYEEWAILMNELVPDAIVAYRSEIWAISDKVSGLDAIDVYTDWTQLVKDVTISQ